MGKKFEQSRKKVNPERLYGVEEALALVREAAYVKFDESVDFSFRLGVDPKHADQVVRGAVVLPHGLGKQVRVVVFAKGEKEREAREAGADEVGAEDLIERITGGWLDFDRVVSTPDLMGMVGKIGKILGPRGLMPNPKAGTVTFEVGKAVREIKVGKVEYKVDKAGVLHVPVGRVSFDSRKLYENAVTILESVVKAKPSASKGRYLKTVTVSSTMGPGIKIDPQAVSNMFE
jgi:large subunit ribosomal protein L1